MIATSLNGSPIYLLDDAPDWRASVRAGFEFAALTEVGLSNREVRRPLGATLRAVIQFQVVATGVAATRLASSLRAWQTEPVAVPLWPAAVRWAERDAAHITSKLRIALRPDFSNWALFEDSGPGWPEPDDMVAPVLLGRIERNEPAWLTPSTCRFDVDFEEASASEYAIVVGGVDWPAGPSPSEAWIGTPPRLMPFRMHHEQPTLGSDVAVERERLGFGRQQVETLYAQANHRRGEAPFVEGSGADIAGILRFFVDHGEGRPFWVPSWAAAAILTTPVAEGASSLSVDAGHDVKPGDWLMLSDGDREAIVPVVSVGAEHLTLESTAGSWGLRTLVSHLVLCRFERPRIQIDWLCPTVAKVRLAIRELPAEYAPAGDENLGVTLGRLPIRAWLYELREATSDAGATIHRFTSFERDLDIDGDLYRCAQVQHGAIRQGIALDRDEVEVRFAVEPGETGHPLVRLATLRCEVPLFLTIRRLDLTLPST